MYLKLKYNYHVFRIVSVVHEMRDLDPFKSPTKTVFLTAVVFGSGGVGNAAMPAQDMSMEYEYNSIHGESFMKHDVFPNPGDLDNGDVSEKLVLNGFETIDDPGEITEIHDSSEFEAFSPQPKARESDSLHAKKIFMKLQGSTNFSRNSITSLEDFGSNYFVLEQNCEMREWVMDVKKSNETFHENFPLPLTDNMDCASMRNIKYPASKTKYDFRGKLIKVK